MATSNGEWTIGRLLDWTRQHLTAKGIEDARLCAELLLAKAMNCPKISLYARFNECPAESQRAEFRELVKSAADQKPIAYLIGHREFYSLDYKVTSDVLIPRPETELIVEKALAWCKSHPEGGTLLDVGTGSGCIALTILKRASALKAVATDIAPAALAVARENADSHGLAERVRFVIADSLDLPADAIPPGGFDVVVSNPPYIAEHEADSLPRNVRDFEPHAALFAGADGLTLYRRIAGGIGRVLKPGGLLLLEIGRGQADAVLRLFIEYAGLRNTGRYADLAGIERTLAFTMPA